MLAVRTFVIMGVAGSGKTTVGQRVASELGAAFLEGDDYHPAENIARMAAGQPLDDDDRLPWITRLAVAVNDANQQIKIVACSALSVRVRHWIEEYIQGRVHFIHLQGSEETISQRMLAREGHYMPATLVKSQFDTLQAPPDAITIDVAQPLDAVCTAALKQIRSIVAD